MSAPTEPRLVQLVLPTCRVDELTRTLVDAVLAGEPAEATALQLASAIDYRPEVVVPAAWG